MSIIYVYMFLYINTCFFLFSRVVVRCVVNIRTHTRQMKALGKEVVLFYIDEHDKHLYLWEDGRTSQEHHFYS